MQIANRSILRVTWDVTTRSDPVTPDGWLARRGEWVVQMADHNFVLKWAHLGLGKNPRHRRIIEEERRAHEAHVAEIQAEQEQKNIALRKISYSHIPVLRVAACYAGGITRRKS